MLVWLCLALLLIELSNHFQLKDPTEKSEDLGQEAAVSRSGVVAPRMGRGPTTAYCLPDANADTRAWTAAFLTAE